MVSVSKGSVLGIAVPVLIVVGLYLGFVAYMGNPTPIMVVTSGSMVPALRIGWVIIVKSVPASQIHVGQIIVYKSTDPEIEDPIVHRVISINNQSGQLDFVTKGDANPVADNVVGFEPPYGIPQNRVIGEVVYVIPYVGYLILFLKEPPVYIFILGLLVILIFLDLRGENKGQKRDDGSEAETVPDAGQRTTTMRTFARSAAIASPHRKFLRQRLPEGSHKSSQR